MPLRKKADHRLTTQRMVILDYVRKDKSHPTAEKIFNAVKKRLPHISFGTVYRNLNFLRGHGYLKECVIDKVARFEARVDSHIHFVCEKCHSITDVDDTRGSAFFSEVKNLAQSNAFYIRSENFEVQGICRKCSKRHSPHLLTPELFCMACGSLLDDLKKDAPVCKSCCFQTNCSYYGPTSAIRRFGTSNMRKT
ncbi:MAG: transcriptional repressor [Patescibacteria group bacterium]|nr:transcriptional repressor [Patescibacteria group bacterium]MDD5715744.1 transcriptional repressor [Patescibacteria group bacterium]